VRVAAKGSLGSGGVLVASTLTVSLTQRRLLGRLDRVKATSLAVRGKGSIDVRVDVAVGKVAYDGPKHVAALALHPGAYVLVIGYVESSGRLWASTIRVEHPLLTLIGAVVLVGTSPTIRASSGEEYKLVFIAGAQILASRYSLPVSASEMPVGARVHASGSMASDGSLKAASATVTLHSETLRGTLVTLGVTTMTLQTAGGTVQGRLAVAATVKQGTKAKSMSDLVPGDDVTASALQLAGNSLLIRKLDLHRKSVIVDGTVVSLTADGFVVNAGSQQVRVITPPGTRLSGSSTQPQAGLTVHVSGYLRGDGVVEASRVRLGK
jgi:hypothetical protein